MYKTGILGIFLICFWNANIIVSEKKRKEKKEFLLENYHRQYIK